MAKTKTPFFSLGARGSVGGSITAQGRNTSTLLREKPLPTYRYSLPQAYQRWLYEDYAYLWRQQDTATRAEYRTGGSRFHLTGFQYWMKVMLSTMPDIAGWWKLDEQTGIISYDSSPREKHGVITGATLADGVIGYCRGFDGINNVITYPAINFGLTGWTWEFWIKAAQHRAINRQIIWHGTPGPNPTYYIRIMTTGKLRFSEGDFPAWSVVDSTIAVDDDQWHHIACVDDVPANLVRLYLDGYQNNTAANSGVSADSATPVYLGTQIPPALAFWGLIDDVLPRYRVLDPTEILRHSLRRYPVQ